MRVLVCGGRNFDDLGRVWGLLDAVHALQGPITVIIQGGARGADHLAAAWAEHNHVAGIEYPPDWHKYGRAAGPLRNQRMLDQTKPDLVVAFPGGVGTADMVRRARAAGVKIIDEEAPCH